MSELLAYIREREVLEKLTNVKHRQNIRLAAYTPSCCA